MGQYTHYNPNPTKKSVGDCTVRAISKALGQSWEQTYIGLALEGFIRGDLPNADSVWGPYLKKHGFVAPRWGVWIEIWDSGGECPVYYWTKER